MASLGSFTLLAAFVVCTYAAAVSVAGARRRSPRLIESGIGASYLVTALMLLASAVIVHAFITEDYSIRTSTSTPTRRSRCSTSSRRTGAGSTGRSCSG